MKYYFILGKNPELSKAEIESVLELFDYKFKIIEFKKNILILEMPRKLDVEVINQRLGGTVKIGQIIDQVNDLEKIANKFCQLIKCQSGKLHFGFSLYSLSDKINLAKKKKQIKPIAMEIKRKMREQKHLNSRWVISQEIELSSVIVKKNQLLKYGSEICLFFSDQQILIGQTLAVQAFAEFGARDYKRPSRDQTAGMLPPKLARIMLNLAKIRPEAKILDPFCGSGTILQEALILGYQNLIGFDSSDNAIKYTQDNLTWLADKYNFDLKNIQLNQVDVKNLNQHLDEQSIDCIITEPYLGPPLKGNEPEIQINKNIQELEELYLEAFKQFQQVLRENGKIVMVIPEFKIKNKTKQLDLDKIKGFKFLNQEKLIYSRPHQYLWRQIKIFIKK
ncbi:MAG: methyltransferase domain-containing protein [Candidatus Buchananbacteria bacterium]|nr:methyltransferase domain-containing protein [Candidatus Buchananbacteria bacterium]